MMKGELSDMALNVMQLMNDYQMLRKDPRQFFSQKHNINIPDDINTNDSNAIIQYMLNNGYKTQQEFNYVQSAKNNPMIQRMFNIH